MIGYFFNLDFSNQSRQKKNLLIKRLHRTERKALVINFSEKYKTIYKKKLKYFRALK